MRSVPCVHAIAVAALLAMSCSAEKGDSSTASPTPTTAQVAGTWSGTLQLTSVSGGECVGTHFQTLIGTPQAYTATLTQSGNAVSATVRGENGLTCQFAGNASINTVFLDLTTCDSMTISAFRCPSNGQLRDLRLVGSNYQATADSPTVVTGTSQETWNVSVSGSQLGLEFMTLRGTFTMTRR
jgi:hypothetical protein